MISGLRTGLEVCLAAACATLAGGTFAAGIDEMELMKLLASVESVTARFVETRESDLLKTPLVSSGTLAYRRPDRMVRHVRAPHEERIVLEKGSLTIENPALGRTTVAALARNPGIAALVESVRATRAGDLAALERHYEMRLTGVREKWRMDLVPRVPELAAYVESVTISGKGARITRMEVREASGDRTVTEIDEELK